MSQRLLLSDPPPVSFTFESTGRSRDKALKLLKNATPGKTVQSTALHLLFAHKFGDLPRKAIMLDTLLGRQNADGGWGWNPENTVSEAFSTGQALYALGGSGQDGRDPRVQRAWDFLLRSQKPDGGWDVPSSAINKREIKLNIYVLWGSAWAALGLMQTLPPAAR